MLKISFKQGAIVGELVGLCIVTDHEYDDSFIVGNVARNKKVLRELIIAPDHPWANVKIDKSLDVVNEFLATLNESNETMYVQMIAETAYQIVYNADNQLDMMNTIRAIKRTYDNQSGLWKKLRKFIKSQNYIYKKQPVDKNRMFRYENVIDLLVFILSIKLSLPVIHILNNASVIHDIEASKILGAVHTYCIQTLNKHSEKTHDAMIDYVKVVLESTAEYNDNVHTIMCRLIAVDFPPMLLEVFADNPLVYLIALIKKQALIFNNNTRQLL